MSVSGAVLGADLPAPWVNNRQTLLETLASYTVDNAWVEFNEHRKGKLKCGYMADVTVMDRDLMSIPTEGLSASRAVVTICNGEISHRL